MGSEKTIDEIIGWPDPDPGYNDWSPYTVDDLVKWLDRGEPIEMWVERVGGERRITVCVGWAYFEGGTLLEALEAAVRSVAS